MSVEWSEFADFYAAIHDGKRPFAWQQRLLDGLAATGAWPDLVSAPTGSGKSVPVIVHVFANAAAASTGVRVPRRLVTVVNRRALVDAQHSEAMTIKQRLVDADGSESILVRVREQLQRLTPRPDRDNDWLCVLNLRGQIRPDRRWVEDPAACTVIAATPDMWGSRLLFGGYGSTRYARPREAGLFAYDTVVALDETHLNQQLAATAVRVRELAAVHADKIGVPAVQVMRLSATQGDDATPVVPNGGDGAEVVDLGLTESDLAADEALGRRLQRPKPVQYAASQAWPGTSGAQAKRYVADIVEQVVAMRDRVAVVDGVAGTLGCIVNRVDTASEVAAALRAAGLTTTVWVGRMRPYDLAKAKARTPGLFSVQGDASVDVLVATSTVEVGVDLDLAGLVTELCPGTSLVQRFGRVNRLGRRPAAPITVVGPAGAADIKDVPPYVGGDLVAAHEWVMDRVADPAGVAPWRVVDHPAPPTTVPRVLLERLEPGIVEVLAATSHEPFTDLALDRWLQDDFDAEREPVFLVPRRFASEDGGTEVRLADDHLLSLLRVAPVLDAEAFPATLKQAQFFTEGILDGSLGRDPRVVDVTEPDAPVLLARGDRVRPGHVYVVPAEVRLARDGIVVQGVGRELTTPLFWGASPREDSPLRSLWEEGSDTSAVATLGNDGEESGLVDVPGEGLAFLVGDVDADGVEWCVELATSDEEELRDRLALVEARGFEAKLPPQGVVTSEGALPWVVFVRSADLARDEDARQEWTSEAAWVALDAHQEAVGRRGEELGTALGLAGDVVARIRDAGRHHDDGKRAAGFQALLREGMDAGTLSLVDGVLLAKSGTPRAVQVRNRGRYLPPRWRHEQMSVAWACAVEGVTDSLTLRLIGTSHGRGRNGFGHLADVLLTGQPVSGSADAVRDVAVELFDHGSWDQLIDDTAAQWGVWGCSYVEAVVRAADEQISQEGS